MPWVWQDKVGTMGIKVELDPSLWSCDAPDAPESAQLQKQKEDAIYRVAQILAELASEAPYGPVGSYSTALHWRLWIIDEKGRDRPLPPDRSDWPDVPDPRPDWWGTTEVSSPVETLSSLKSALDGILTYGTESAALRDYQLRAQVRARAYYIEVDSLSVRWICGDCKPGVKRENRDTRRLRSRRFSR